MRSANSRPDSAAPAPSSSSSSARLSGLRAARKRPIDEEFIADVEEIEQPAPRFESSSANPSMSFLFEGISKPTLEFRKVKVSEKEEQRFQAISSDAQNTCIKAVARLFLFKGTKQETVTRKNVSDALAAIDAEYKGHVNAAVAKAQRVLYDTFGYSVLSGEALGESAGGAEMKKDCYYLVSSVPCLALRQLLAQRPTAECAYAGFKLMVFCSIISKPDHFASCEDVLSILRKVENRFPETLLSRSQSASVPVAELKLDFMGLLNRMQKEHYIMLAKGDIEDSKKFVHFGPRFYAEIGKEKLLAAFGKLNNSHA